MLYEKQEKYQKAIEVCVEAIQIGAYDDHSNGKMYGRLARMIKKSGIDVTDEIKQLTLLQ
jgi:selenophosphate synthetase-related protein